MRVSEIRRETPSVKTFRLTPLSGATFDFLPGQFVEVTESSFSNAMKGFSIASPPTRKDHIEITVKRALGGVFTEHLHTSAKVGDILSVRGPFGDFTYGENDQKAVLIGVGSGITPLMCMIRYITDKNLDVSIKLVYSARTSDEIIFRSEMEELQSKFSNLLCYYNITRPAGHDWGGKTGRITPSYLDTIIDDTTASFYVCVPHGMTADILYYLEYRNVEPEQIKKERW